MRFEWDDQKNEINIPTAVLIFEDPNCLTFPERIEAGEMRWHAIGAEQTVRIISARRTASHERKLYAEAIL